MLKISIFFLVAVAVLGSCTEILPSSYQIVLPALPDTWEAVLGTPRWRLEWINEAGEKERRDFDGADNNAIAITVMQEWTTPIVAYPYWSSRGLFPGTMKPAGALFPLDVDGTRLVLTWHGGIDASLYGELAAAAGTEKTKAFTRLPLYFNWVGFRELLRSDSINEDLRADPWQADWRTLAARLVRSGFDRRALVPQARQRMLFPVADGTWIGTSPFAAALDYQNGVLIAFLIDGLNTFVSSAGVLRCTQDAWILVKPEDQ
ncbi:MAG: hypothetical protein LBO67_07485 [Spirochaetaceae bacterium]|jgi:hypothetical protein|nr:hypothetical protein [Spirochaetaceae bacterium]